LELIEIALNSSSQAKETNKARPFNPFLCANSEGMRGLLLEVQQQVEGYEIHYQLRKRARRAADQETFERILESLICDLCISVLQPQYDAIHLPLSNQVLRSKSRYKGLALGKTLPNIIDVLIAEEMGFAGLMKGYSKFKISDENFNIAFDGGQQSTLWADEKLLSRIKRFDISYDDIRQDETEEVIIVRAVKEKNKTKGGLVEYEDTFETNNLRDEIREINSWLQSATITADHDSINSFETRLRRIFNNNDINHGGRLYGGFWQYMTSTDRLGHILIDEESVIELDYGQMSLMILYGMLGERPEEGDLYDLSAYGISNEYRKGIKKCIQAIINSPKIPSKVPKGTRKLLPAMCSMSEILSAVQLKHSLIYSLMTSDIGMELFRKESDILVDVLLTLKGKGIVALPIHDAVIVKEEDKQETIIVMKDVFKEHTGLIPNVTLDKL
jgi:hypothetical protein